ncbi:MAG: hypothetical protein V1787_00250 [Candidatus Micrarchaeota archaeon]
MIEEQLAALASAAFASGEALAGRFGATVFFLSVGIAVYAAIIGTFYHHLSRRVLYETKRIDRKGIWGFFLRFGNAVEVLLKYTVLFPAISFLWFAVLASSLFLISRTAELETVFVLAISVVIAVRALAYYKEEISVDLAKMLPLALLGVFIVEPTLYSREIIGARILQLLGAIPQFAAFIAIAIMLEWTLRILDFLAGLARGRQAASEKPEA